MSDHTQPRPQVYREKDGTPKKHWYWFPQGKPSLAEIIETIQATGGDLTAQHVNHGYQWCTEPTADELDAYDAAVRDRAAEQARRQLEFALRHVQENGYTVTEVSR